MCILKKCLAEGLRTYFYSEALVGFENIDIRAMLEIVGSNCAQHIPASPRSCMINRMSVNQYFASESKNVLKFQFVFPAVMSHSDIAVKPRRVECPICRTLVHVRNNPWLHIDTLRWLGGKTPSAVTSTPLDEPNALANAMASAMLAMNDEVEQAEFELSEKTTPFHKLGRGAALFLRAGLGFEKEIMDQASRRLAESEQSATEHLKLAKQNPSSVHQSEIYPVGAEFALCQAESQLMFAVIAVLNQNLTESLKGLYKIRKAFFTLTEIHKAEEKYLENRRNGSISRASSSIGRATTSGSGTAHSNSLPANGTHPQAFNTQEDDDDDDEFVDAEESKVEPIKLDFTPITNGAPDLHSGIDDANAPLDFRTITSDPIDLYIHSGTSMSFGLIQLVLCKLELGLSQLAVQCSAIMLIPT
nr:mitochondrial outer membrane protein iml2 [Quercus suber]